MCPAISGIFNLSKISVSPRAEPSKRSITTSRKFNDKKELEYIIATLVVLLYSSIMHAEIITIGDELLSGKTINTNAAFIAGNLLGSGITTRQITVVGDSKSAIIQALTRALKNHDIVILTGGLGPTNDDVTKLSLAEFFESDLVSDPQVLKDVEEFFLKRNLGLTEKNRNQALVPAKAKIIRNRYGTAPGMWFDANEKIVIALPGVPFEMKNILEFEIIPRLKNRFSGTCVVQKTVNTLGIGESFLFDKLADWETNLHPQIRLAYLPAAGIVKLRLTAKGQNEEFLNSIVEAEIQKLEPLISKYIWGFDNDTLEGICAALLLQKKQTLTTAESCTGGYLAHKITALPGSSQYYKGSIIAYSNALKTKLLNIPESEITGYGSVSKQVVELMAINGCKAMQSDYCVAISGIAGPGGASIEKPLGTVWIAVAHNENVISAKFQFGDQRHTNIVRSAVAALGMLREVLLK